MTNPLKYAETPEEISDATASLIINAIQEDRKERAKTKRICVICACVSLVSALIFACVFGLFSAGMTIDTSTTTTTTTATTQTGEGDTVQFNNVKGNMSIGSES